MMKPSMLRHIIAVLAAAALCVACAAQRPADGPGMTVTFSSTIKGKKIHLHTAVSSGKQGFPNAGGFGPNANPMTGGATMGAAPDGRDLPEWVEFAWTEWPYPYPDQPSDPFGRQAWNDYFDLLKRTLPHKTARVPVRARVPRRRRRGGGVEQAAGAEGAAGRNAVGLFHLVRRRRQIPLEIEKRLLRFAA